MTELESLQQAFDEMRALSLQRLEALKEAERQRDELFAVLDCVSTNLKTGMSRRIQKLQAKTVDEKMFVIAATLKG